MALALRLRTPRLRQSRRPPAVPCSSEDVAELRATVAGLPVLVLSRRVARPITLDDALLRVEAALWDLSRRFELDVSPSWSIGSMARALRAHGWTVPPARDALRALEMLAAAPAIDPLPPEREIELCDAVGRLLGYLELRSAFG